MNPKKHDWTNVNLVFDGNSLVSGIGSRSSALPAKVVAIPPIDGSIAAFNFGVSGQSTIDMIKRAEIVDRAYDGNKTNILMIWEGTNSICNTGRSANQALSDLQDYIMARRAGSRQWVIVALTTLPRQTGPKINNQDGVNRFNDVLLDYNTGLVRIYRALGADAVCDVRQTGSPFKLPDWSPASFAEHDDLWSERSGERVHLNDAGYLVVARFIVRTLSSMLQ